MHPRQKFDRLSFSRSLSIGSLICAILGALVVVFCGLFMREGVTRKSDESKVTIFDTDFENEIQIVGVDGGIDVVGDNPSSMTACGDAQVGISVFWSYQASGEAISPICAVVKCDGSGRGALWLEAYAGVLHGCELYAVVDRGRWLVDDADRNTCEIEVVVRDDEIQISDGATCASRVSCTGPASIHRGNARRHDYIIGGDVEDLEQFCTSWRTRLDRRESRVHEYPR